MEKNVSGVLNAILWSSNILGKAKTLIYKSTIEIIMTYGSETWTLSRRRRNKLLATEMVYWRRSVRKSRRQRIRNTVIIEMRELEKKNILERIEQKQLQWYGHVKRMENDRLSTVWCGKQKAGEGKADPWGHG
jgi:hypothetical protein